MLPASVKHDVDDSRLANPRGASSATVSSTGWTSLGELEMTRKDFADRGLLLQRLGQIVGALAQFVEQPRVFDGDDGLRGEVLDQLDLLIGERADLLAVDHDAADRNCFP